MAITDITDKILADAAKEAKHILAGAERNVQKVKERAETTKKEVLEQHEKDLKRTLAENEKRVAAAAHQEVKLQIDSAKRSAVDKVFAEALKQLLFLTDEEYGEVLKRALSSLPRDTEGEVIVPKGREAITKKVLTEMKIKIPITPTGEFGGGVMVIGDNFRYNLTFENLLADKKSALEVDVARILLRE